MTRTRWQTALALGRVSNLPTVWTNVMAGLALNGAVLHAPFVIGLAVALSAFYVGGMYLNDAFDARWDAQHRRERPIPAGEVAAGTVLAAGFGLLASGMLLLAVLATTRSALAGGAALGALIVAYDLAHKGNRFGPLLMGLCRAAVYVTAALAWGAPPRPQVWLGAALLLAYVAALSAVARRETQDPRTPRLVGLLIAGIAILDAVLLALTGHLAAAALAAGAFLLTRTWQRRIAGT